MLNRILFSDNGTLTDLSTDLENYHSGTGSVVVVAAEDKIFLGSYFPFNHRYIKIDTANTNVSAMTFKLWDGSNFLPVVELIDETSVGGVTLSQSGFVTFVPDREESWQREDTKDKNNNLVTGLDGVTIYDQYWIEVTFDNDLSAGTDLSWVGNLFADDNDLATEFPDLLQTTALTSFEAGKTDWEEQHVLASKILIEDLRAQKVIDSGDRILDRREFRTSCVQKTAEIIFSAFGDDFKDQRDKARQEYQIRLDKDIFNIDANNDARINLVELGLRQGRLTR